MRILGISAYYHDSAAALLVDGNPLAAAQEERFTRVKHDHRFPHRSIEYCLHAAGCALSDIDKVAFYDKPFLTFERLLETYLAFAPRGFKSFRTAIPVWLREKLFQKDILLKELRKHGDFDDEQLLFSEHHLSHAASAFYPSPFEEAVVLTMDGVGEWASTSIAYGKQNQLEIHKEIHFPHSLGLLYSAFTYYTGFKVNSGEYKLMGLAPYGVPKYVDLIYDHLIDVKADGSYWLDQSYFDYCTGLTMTDDNFDRLFGRPARQPEMPLEQFHMDVAASIQEVTETIVVKLSQGLAKEFDCPNICLAGGVALNCVANGRIHESGGFKNLWIQPASGDAGGSLGAAYTAYHRYLQKPRKPRTGTADDMLGSYLGPEFSDAQIEAELRALGASFKKLTPKDAIDYCAQAISNDQVVGWFRGRMEFGPRALGGRSILGNAQSPDAQKQINLKIKFRESFRPFAPSVPQEHVGEWFELDDASPYMLLVKNVREEHHKPPSSETAAVGLEQLNQVRSSIPAVTHVDYSARIQTVHKETNPDYHKLLLRVGELTGTPVVVNTSFNVRGEPIVCTPEDAFRCFMGTDMDVLALGNFVLEKAEQSSALRQDYKDQFELD